MHEAAGVKRLADAMATDWDLLHSAVLARLTQLSGHITQPALSSGLSECVQALQQLQACRVVEPRHRQCNERETAP